MNCITNLDCSVSGRKADPSCVTSSCERVLNTERFFLSLQIRSLPKQRALPSTAATRITLACSIPGTPEADTSARLSTGRAVPGTEQVGME